MKNELKQMLTEMTKLIMEALHKSLLTIPERAAKEGITPKELYDRDIKNFVWDQIKDISEDLSKLPENFPDREELFELHENVIELLESYENMKHDN
jgi:hypothetical protein